MMPRLAVYLGADRAGTLHRSPNGRCRFEYVEAYQRRETASPLSLSMPLSAKHHQAKTVEPFFWGLLPDNEVILDRWARRYQVSARSVFGLLEAVGQDCPGAVRVLRDDVDPNAQRSGVDWLTEAEVAERIRQLRADASAWRMTTDAGQFSLAGAQPKTALLCTKERWGVPYGQKPTTHILKPGIVGLDGSAENEHFCMSLASELGLPTAKSEVRRFEDETVIVIERYDRLVTLEEVIRVHQEDLCQALAVHPSRKYENEGGPTVSRIVRLLHSVSSSPEEDTVTFLSALILNWIVAGTDAHAKNFSLLLGTAGRVRLAPLYDVASSLPYPEMPMQKLKLAMKIGGKYRIRDIGAYQWQKLATEISMPPGELLDRVSDLTRVIPDAATAVLERTREAGLTHPILHVLSKAIRDRARALEKQIHR